MFNTRSRLVRGEYCIENPYSSEGYTLNTRSIPCLPATLTKELGRHDGAGLLPPTVTPNDCSADPSHASEQQLADEIIINTVATMSRRTLITAIGHGPGV